MSKQYFAYIPFNESPGTRELVGGVNAWRNNVASIRRINDSVMRSIKSKESMIEKEMVNGVDKNTDLIRDCRADIEILKQQLEAGPTLREEKMPTLIMKGGSLGFLGRRKPEEYVLYIVGHCAPGSASIRETQSYSTSRDGLSALELLNRLVEDGMPRNILNIKLLCCFGAVDHTANGVRQKAFSQEFWKVLRGYCTSLVRLTAYREAILLTSFYKEPELRKTFAHVKMGEILDEKVVKSPEKLSSIAKKYQARRCPKCHRLIQQKCTGKKCLVELCEPCMKTHAPNLVCPLD